MCVGISLIICVLQRYCWVEKKMEENFLDRKNRTHGADEKTKMYYMGYVKFRDNFGALGRCNNFNK